MCAVLLPGLLWPCWGGTTPHSLLQTLILKTRNGQPSIWPVTFFLLVLAALVLKPKQVIKEQGQLFFAICVRQREWERGLLWDWYCHTTDVIVPLLTAEPWLSLSRSPFASDNKPNRCPQLNIFSCTTYVHFWSLDYFFFLQSPSVLLPLRYFSYHGNDNIIWMGGASCSVKLVSYMKCFARYGGGWQNYSIPCESFSCFWCAAERYLCVLMNALGLFQEGRCCSFLICQKKSFTWALHDWFFPTFSSKLDLICQDPAVRHYLSPVIVRWIRQSGELIPWRCTSFVSTATEENRKS